jgi:hypothetical protein
MEPYKNYGTDGRSLCSLMGNLMILKHIFVYYKLINPYFVLLNGVQKLQRFRWTVVGILLKTTIEASIVRFRSMFSRET